tara:strand:+ start:7101 stop:7370 length:270 start_codon:yes stop_codon:yes gene_type:complete
MKNTQRYFQEAIAYLKNDKFNDASLLLYHNFPKFENYLNAQGLAEIAPGLPLRQWHEQQSVLFHKLTFTELPGTVFANNLACVCLNPKS